MIPHLSKNDLNMFYKYLNKSHIYFEYGSGGSTYQSFLRNNIIKIYSVESDLDWHNKLKFVLKNNPKVDFIYNEMDTLPNSWGHAGPNATNIQKINYSNQLGLLPQNICNAIDLILIDGRFRVACCLKAFNLINDNCIIAFDDFMGRREYHVVLKYFDIIEKTKDNRMVILKKKKSIEKIENEIIEKYELISN